MNNDLAARRAKLSPTKLALLEKRLRNEVSGPTRQPSIARRPSAEPAPLSFAQERLWFLHRLDPASPAYNMHNLVRLQGPLHLAALEESLNELVRRHEILRTTFASLDKRLIQQVRLSLTLTVPLIEVQPDSGVDPESYLQPLLLEEIRRPFDLSQGPLIRLKLFRLAPIDHILTLTVPHIIFDEWSNELFWRELSALYPAFAEGKPSPLPDLPLQYADFAYWQKQELPGELLETQLDYWRKQLAGDLPRLQLPFDFPRPPVQTFNGAVASLLLPPELIEALKSLSQRAGATLFMTFLAAFKVLLYRYAGQTDLLVGTPVTNRSRPELQGLIGLFLNTLVIRSYPAGDQTFLDFLEQIRQTALDVYAHQELPFEKLVDELKPGRDPSYNPLFQVMFVYQKDAGQQLDLPQLRTQQSFLDTGVAKFDLTLFVRETEQGLGLAIEYNTALFEAATINRMLGHLQVLLKAIAVEPEQPLATLSLLTKPERLQLLLEWNDTGADYPRTLCIHQLFEAQAARQPEAIALQVEGAQLTYGELNRRANGLAHELQARGVEPGVKVALFMERSLEMILAILGVLKAGGAYLPLDPTYPEERLAFMLADSQAPLVLTHSHLVEALPKSEAEVICLDTGWPVEVQAPVTTVTAANLAYVIYTSGSTGQPKGVQITHRNLVHSTVARLNYYPEAVTRFLLLSSFAFDSSIVGIFGTLCQGATLVLPPPRLEVDAQGVAGLIERYEISHILSLPSLYNLLLTYAGPGQLDSLQIVIVAGEACPKALAECHYQLLPGTTLYNEYGPTEATVWSTVHRVSAGDSGRPVPIGRPILNTQLYILDQYRQPVPVGIPGEIYIGGEGLSPGYLNRPDLTAEKFIPHPFSSDPQARLYKTGDLARYRPDGMIEFLGRIDHQVKIRGYRVELGEIEAVLEEHPLVREAVVVVRERTEGQAEAANLDDLSEVETLFEALSALPETEAGLLLAEIEQLSEVDVTRFLGERGKG